jgi:hypothetical protein
MKEEETWEQCVKDFMNEEEAQRKCSENGNYVEETYRKCNEHSMNRKEICEKIWRILHEWRGNTREKTAEISIIEKEERTIGPNQSTHRLQRKLPSG